MKLPKILFFLLVMVSLNSFAGASDAAVSRTEDVKNSDLDRVPFLAEEDEDEDFPLMNPAKISRNIEMNSDEIAQLLDRRGWTFSQLLKRKSDLDAFQGAQKQVKALEWANQVIGKKDLQIMNYLYEHGRICQNLQKIKRYLDVRFKYQIIHGTLERYLKSLGLDVYYDENNNEIKLKN